MVGGVIVPADVRDRRAQHWLFDKFKVNELASLLITFSFAVILESASSSTGPPTSAATRPNTHALDQGRAVLHPRDGADRSASWRPCSPGAPGCGCAAPMSARRCAPLQRIPAIAAAYRRRPQEAGLSPVRHRRRLCRHRRHLHRADRDPRAGADLGLSRRRLRRGHHRPAGQSDGRAAGRHADRRQRIARHGGAEPGLGAGRVLLGADRRSCCGIRTGYERRRDLPRLAAVSASACWLSCRWRACRRSTIRSST